MEVINFLGDRLGSGGIESFVTNASEGMYKEDINYFICVNYWTENIYEERILKNKAYVSYLSGCNETHIKKLIKFLKYLRRHSDAILYLHASSPGMYLYAAIAKACGVNKIVYHIHSTPNPQNSRVKNMKDSVLNLLFRKIPNVRIACSETAGKLLYREMPFTVVNNGIDLERFRYSEKTRRKIRKELNAQDKLIVGHVGRLAYPKNQLFTLRVLKKYLQDVNDNILVVFIGDGKDKEFLEKFVTNNNLEQNVRFIKPTSHIENLYSAMDLLMFPSNFEGLGIVAIEAQASGLPVLCSQHIVDEVYVTDSIYRMDLSGIDEWVHMWEDIRKRHIDRDNASDKGIKKCTQAGFSLDGLRKKLIDVYNNLEKYH